MSQFIRKAFWRHRLTPALALLAVLVSLIAGCAGAGGGAGGVPTMTAEQEAGKRLFVDYCASCHSTLPDTVIVGPSMAGVAQRAGQRVEGMGAATYLRRSILEPGEYVVEGFKDRMPPNLHNALTEEQIDALVAYLMTLD